MTLATLVVGATAAQRETAIANALEPGTDTTIILEGLPDGSGGLEQSEHFSRLRIARIAPGCLCCTGNLTMRVTLNRMLRHRPSHLYIGLATDTHLEQIRQFLSQTPYSDLLQLTKDLHA